MGQGRLGFSEQCYCYIEETWNLSAWIKVSGCPPQSPDVLTRNPWQSVGRRAMPQCYQICAMEFNALESKIGILTSWLLPHGVQTQQLRDQVVELRDLTSTYSENCTRCTGSTSSLHFGPRQSKLSMVQFTSSYSAYTLSILGRANLRYD
ncbi:hypothetical protein GQ44DRAFT_469766 [Phaeosphaeriaceae sp. PMI808]|nr:hypothetical protein GQ44DRAFT_469766 [Phaeosphaeriaceae sp. PMI808]